MNEHFMIGSVVLLACLVLARILSHLGLQKLDGEKKAELVDLFSKQGVITLVLAVLIIIIFLVVTHYRLVETKGASYIYFGIIFLMMLVSGYVSFKKLSRHKFPANYIRITLLSSFIRIVGLLAFLYLFLLSTRF